jgi:hypothetical protein
MVIRNQRLFDSSKSLSTDVLDDGFGDSTYRFIQ